MVIELQEEALYAGEAQYERVFRMVLEVLIGRKGEIYTPKGLRESLGLKPGDKLLVEVRGDQLILRKPPSLDEVLAMKPKVEISLEDDLKLREEISRRLEGEASP